MKVFVVLIAAVFGAYCGEHGAHAGQGSKSGKKKKRKL